MDTGDRMQEELDVLRQIRDELRVQVHLGKAEAKEAFEHTERKFEEIEATVKLVAREAGKPLHEMGDSFRKLAHELRVGYDRVRGLI